MYCYIWSYSVRPEHLEEFRTAYGLEGEWVRLFRRDPEYVRTALLSDRQDELRFLTIDYWTSHEAFLSFRERVSAEFEALDRKFEQLTLEEAPLGEFEIVDAP